MNIEIPAGPISEHRVNMGYTFSPTGLNSVMSDHVITVQSQKRVWVAIFQKEGEEADDDDVDAEVEESKPEWSFITEEKYFDAFDGEVVLLAARTRINFPTNLQVS